MDTGREQATNPAAPPRTVAVSGLVFSILFIIALVLLRLVIPADPDDPGEWLADSRVLYSVRMALRLIPFTGIAFLWFMAVLRNRIGPLEDRFFATVFLGSGLLFTGMLFVCASIASGLVDTFDSTPGHPVVSDTYEFGRRICFTLMNIYAIKMAAVFIFVTSSIGIRTAFLPRWLAFIGFGAGLVLLLVIFEFSWIALLIPLWVLLLSSYILIADFRGQPQHRG